MKLSTFIVQRQPSKVVILSIIISVLFIEPLFFAAGAQTSRTVETMLSNRTYKAATPYQQKKEAEKTFSSTEQKLNSSQTKKKHLSGSSQQKKKTEKTFSTTEQKLNPSQAKKKSQSGSSQILSGVKIEIQSCKNVPEYKSITCDMTLTNQEHDIETVIHCYTGTTATDEKGNNLQCAHAWLGSNHSWNFAYGKLVKGTPVKGMVRLEAKRPPEKLKKLEISLALNGVTQTTTLNNIPVR